jgi:Ca2+-binding EF-hand superfamily protein
MKTTTLYPIAFTIAACLSFPVIAANDVDLSKPPKHTSAEKSKQHLEFEKIDANNDSNISMDEAKSNEWMAKNFAVIDANKDGLITHVEFLMAAKEKA